MNRHRWLVFVLLSMAIMVSVLTACSTTGNPFKMEPVAPELLSYPGAQSAGPSRYDDPSATSVINQQTQDNPATVLAHYQNVLPQEGWVAQPQRGTPSPNRLYY